MKTGWEKNCVEEIPKVCNDSFYSVTVLPLVLSLPHSEEKYGQWAIEKYDHSLYFIV